MPRHNFMNFDGNDGVFVPRGKRELCDSRMCSHPDYSRSLNALALAKDSFSVVGFSSKI